MNATDSYRAANVSATTSDFPLHGGIYTFAASATWGGGTVKVQALGPDASAYVDVPNASLTANGFAGPFYLPAGQYRINVATATAVYAVIAQVPIG